MRVFVLIGFMFLFGLELQAQNNNPMRIEVDSRTYEDVYGLPLDNGNFLILKSENRHSNNGVNWVLDLYDSSFKKKNSKKLLLPRGFTPVKYRINGDSILWLAYSEEGGAKGSFMLYRFNLHSGLMWSKYVKGSRKSVFSGFEIIGNRIIIFGEKIEDIADQLIESKMPFGIEFIYPTLSKYGEVITSLSLDNNEKAVLIVEVDKGNNSGLYYFEYTTAKDEVDIYALETGSPVNIIDGSLVISDDGSLLLLGTFNYNVGRETSSDKVVANGTFIGKVVNKDFQFFKTNEFLEYRNIFATLTANEQKQLKQKHKQGKEVSLGFKMLTHKKVLKQRGLYVVSAETYYPEYHYESSFDSRGYMYQNQVFDGYRTTNCIVSAYNETGDMVWDNYMHSSEILEFNLQESVLVFAEADSNIVMAYYHDGNVYSKTVSGNDIVFKKSEDKIETVLGNSILSERYGRIQHWYDSYFVLSGYQVLYGTNGEKKKVFFFNLISFE